MKNQLCFTLKVRSGARTEPYIVCDPLCVNDDEILINGKKVSASTISKSVISFIVGRYVSPIKENAEAVEQPLTQVKSSTDATAKQNAAIIQTAEGFVKLGCPYNKLYKLIINDLRQLLLT